MSIRFEAMSNSERSRTRENGKCAAPENRMAADILENLMDPVVAFDRSYRYTFISRRAGEVLHKTPEEMLGRSMWDLFPEDIDIGFRDACERAWAQRKPITVESYSQASDGWVEIYICPLDAGSAVAQWRDITERKRAEDGLRESEAQFRTLANAIPQLCWIANADGWVYWYNQRWYEYTGTAPDLMEGWGWQSVHDPATLPSVLDRWKHSIAAGEPFDMVFPLRGADGVFRPFLTRIMPVRDREGRVARWFGTNTDVSEQGKTEEALRDSEEKLRSALRRQDLLSEVLRRLLTSEEPQTIVNDLAGKVMALLDCQVFFNYLVDFRENRLRLNACAGIPDDVARGISTLEFGVAVCGCVAQLGSRIVAENIPETPDPRTDLVKSFGVKAYACHPLLSAGRVIGTLSFGSTKRSRFSPEDLELMRSVADHIAIAMERARTKESLQRSEALYRGIARSLPDGLVCAVDPELRCIAVGGELAVKWGLEPAKIEGRPVLEAVDEGMRSAVESHFRLALAGVTASYETEMRGGIVWSQYTPLREENGSLVGAMLLAVDVSERKRAEERLRHAQKLESVGLLAGGIAHDFNNLLTGVMGNASLLLDGAQPEQAEMIKGIISSTERAAHLTRQLLAYSGKGQFVTRELDVSEAVNETADLVQFSIPKSARLKLDLERRLPLVRMDPGQLQQILMNLVINAGEAIGEGHPGAITVTTSMADLRAPFVDAIGEEIAAGRYACIDVSDTGSGIAPDKRAKIFDPFFTTKFIGRGLGLAAVAGIVRSQKGGIVLESEPGKGTTFRVYLPASGAGAEQAVEAAAADGRATVMVVDDESAVRSFIGAVLRRKGYNVLTASDGQEALALCPPGGGRLDAAIVDIVMPNMSANELLPALRSRRPGVKILLTSGYSEMEARRLCAAYPSATFIQKPYTAQQIAKAMADLLDRAAAA